MTFGDARGGLPDVRSCDCIRRDGRDSRPHRQRQNHAGQLDPASVRSDAADRRNRRRRCAAVSIRRNCGARSASFRRRHFCSAPRLRENIAWGVPDATEEQIRWAAEIAGLAPRYRGFPNGLETVIGERGLTLSGGQKQRTAIARAILRNPRILILDDALSSVDTVTEERILSGLAKRDARPHDDPDFPSRLHGAERRPHHRARSRQMW